MSLNFFVNNRYLLMTRNVCTKRNQKIRLKPYPFTTKMEGRIIFKIRQMINFQDKSRVGQYPRLCFYFIENYSVMFQ